MKNSIFAALMTLASFGAQAQDDKVPMFFDVHVELQSMGITVLAGDVVLPRNQTVTVGDVKDITMPYTCPPNTTMTPITYQDGGRIKLAAWGTPFVAGIYVSYVVATADPEEKRMMGTCEVKYRQMHMFTGDTQFPIRPGDTINMGMPQNITLTLKGMSTTAPIDRPIGKLVRTPI